MSKKDLQKNSTNSHLIRHDDIDEELFKKFQQAENQNSNIQDFITEFLGQFISEQTQKAYISDLNAFFSFLKKGGLFVSHPNQIKGTHFQFYRDFLFEKQYSSATVNRKLVAIRSFIKWAMALKLIDHNPLDVVKLPKVETETPTKAFDDHEVVQMLNAPDLSTKKGHLHKLIIHMLFSLGLRRSELAKIKIKDITQERGHYVLRIKGKGDKTRFLPLSKDVIIAIQDYMDAMAKFKIHFEAEDFLLQSTHKGKNSKPMDGSTIYRVINKYAKQCGINKKVSPHSCRATAISHLLDTQKTPIRDVAIFAGHSKITTTERYDKRRESLDNSAAYDIDYFSKKSAS